MIITCGKCDTSYELNESLIKEEGSRVRCKNCSSVFTVYPPRMVESIEPEPDLELDMPLSAGIATGSMKAESLDLTDIEKLLEIQEKSGPAGIEITENEPELSFDSDGEDDSGLIKIKIKGDPEDLNLSDIEKMLEAEDTKSASLKITEEEPELSLDLDAGLDDLMMNADTPDEEADALDLSDIEKILDTKDKKPASLKITEEEPELSLAMETGHEDLLATDEGQDMEMDLGLPDLEKMLEAEGVSDPQGIQLTDEEPELSLETEDDDDFNFSMEDDPERSLELDLEPEETAHTAEKTFGAKEDLDLNLDLDMDLELEMEDSQDTGLEPELETDSPELELDLDSEDFNLEMDLDESLDPETEELTLFESEPEPSQKTKKPENQEAATQALKAEESEFTLDLDDDEEGTEVDTDSEDEGEFFLNTREAVHSDTFAMSSKTHPQNIKKAAPPRTPDAVAPPKKSKAWLYFLLFLLILGGGGFGAITYLNQKGIELPFVASLFGKPGEVTALESSLKYNFHENAEAGTLLVISGNVENKFKHDRSRIQVIGEVLGKDQQIIKSETVFCGNILNTQELANGDLSTLKKRLLNPEGISKSNVNVHPGGQVPFMVVFSDLPDSIKEFRVKVVGSEAAGR